MSDKGICNQAPAGQESHLFTVAGSTKDLNNYAESATIQQTKNLLLTVKVHCIWCGKKVKCRGWIHE